MLPTITDLAGVRTETVRTVECPVRGTLRIFTPAAAAGGGRRLENVAPATYGVAARRWADDDVVITPEWEVGTTSLLVTSRATIAGRPVVSYTVYEGGRTTAHAYARLVWGDVWRVDSSADDVDEMVRGGTVASTLATVHRMECDRILVGPAPRSLRGERSSPRNDRGELRSPPKGQRDFTSRCPYYKHVAA